MEPSRVVVVILGMHKSGTTLVARLFHESGISMGRFDADKSYDQGNHFERATMLEINRRILGDQDHESFDSFRGIGQNLPEPAILRKMHQAVQKAEQGHSPWGFKDPRTSLTYGLWKPVLPAHRIVFVFRHPEEVCWHYVRRLPRWRVFDRLKRARKVLRAWFVYNEASRQHILDVNVETLVLSYSDLMKCDEMLGRLSNFVNQPLRDCRDRSMYRAGRGHSIEYLLARLWCKLIDRTDVEFLHGQLDELSVQSTACAIGGPREVGR